MRPQTEVGPPVVAIDAEPVAERSFFGLCRLDDLLLEWLFREALHGLFAPQFLTLE